MFPEVPPIGELLAFGRMVPSSVVVVVKGGVVNSSIVEISVVFKAVAIGVSVVVRDLM